MVEHVLQLEILMIFCVPTWEKYNWWRLNHAWMMKMSNWHIWCPAVVKNQEGPLLHFCICWSGLSCNSLHSNNYQIFAKILLKISFEYFQSSVFCFVFFLAPDVVRRPPVQQLWHSQKSCCRVDLFKKYNPSHEEEEERVGVRKSETFQAARFFCKNFLDKVSQFSNLRQMCLKFVDGLKNFQVIQTLFRFSRHFLNRLETFQIIQPLFRSSRDLPDHPDTFQTIQTLSRSSGHIF